jgi:hypothetical protein
MSKNYFIILVLFIVFHLELFAYNFDDLEPIKCGAFDSKRLAGQILVKLDTAKFDSTGRPITQLTAISPSGLFAFHYDTTGKNKVPLADHNLNGIPDFVDSALYFADYAYKVFVDSIGFIPPPLDSGGGTLQYDFYLLEIGNGYYADVYYGYTDIEKQIAGPPISPFPKFTSFVVIDNDFSEKDSIFFDDGLKRPTFREPGLMGLKITIAHELHHMIQFGYGDPSYPSFNEMTSTFMEYRVYPETRDYIQFVKSLFSNFSKYIFGDPISSVGYRYAIFMQYIYRMYGDTPCLKMWEKIGNGIEPMPAFESALNYVGSSLPSALANFLPWIYYSGNKAIPGRFFPHASEFPPIKYVFEDVFRPPAFMTSSNLRPFEIRPVRCFFLSQQPNILNDTLAIFMVNLDLQSAIQQRRDSAVAYSITISNAYIDNSRQLYPRELFYKFNSDYSLIADSIFWNVGYLTITLHSPFPNPWKINSEEVNFPVPTEVPIDEKVELHLFDANMNEVALPSYEYPISVVNKFRVVHFGIGEFPAGLSRGVYFFKVRYKNNEIFGKLGVIE